MADYRKRILNRAESETSQELQQILAEHGCTLFTKIRVADVLNVEDSQLSKEEFSYALKSHFDFVVADEVSSVGCFAVEYDGPGHASDRKTIRRDQLKDSICNKLGFPVLRVESEFLRQTVGKLQLLPLFIKVWFHGRAFYEMQSQGHIPADEDFDPYWVIEDYKNGRLVRTYGLSDLSLHQYQRYYVRKIVRTPSPVFLQGKDSSGRYAVCLGLAYVEGGVLFSTGCFRSINFGYFLPENIAEDIAMIDLAKQLPRFVEGLLNPSSYKQVEKEFRRWDFQPWTMFRDAEGFPGFSWSSKGHQAC